MDAWLDMWVILVSVLFTVLAGFLTAHLFARNKRVPGKTDANPASSTEQSSKEELSGLCEPQSESEHTAQAIEKLRDKQCAANQQEVTGDRCDKDESERDFSSSHCPAVNRMCDADQALKYMPGVLRTSQLEKMMSKEELEEEQSKQKLLLFAKLAQTIMVALALSLSYLEITDLFYLFCFISQRSSIRVQREQLTAIFKLLQENQDTFGEVTEKDMEEQLKLYSI